MLSCLLPLSGISAAQAASTFHHLGYDGQFVYFKAVCLFNLYTVGLELENIAYLLYTGRHDDSTDI